MLLAGETTKLKSEPWAVSAVLPVTGPPGLTGTLSPHFLAPARQDTGGGCARLAAISASQAPTGHSASGKKRP